VNEKDEKLREAYTGAREERANADTLLWEVSAIIWGGQTLLLGFVLEAISGHSGALILVIVVALTGIFMSFFNRRVTRKRSVVCREMVEAMAEIEGLLDLPIRPQARITAAYEKGSQTKWSHWFDWLFATVWFVVIIVGILRLCGRLAGS